MPEPVKRNIYRRLRDIHEHEPSLRLTPELTSDSGDNVGIGKGHPLFAKADGTVRFETKGATRRKVVRIEPVPA